MMASSLKEDQLENIVENVTKRTFAGFENVTKDTFGELRFGTRVTDIVTPIGPIETPDDLPEGAWPDMAGRQFRYGIAENALKWLNGRLFPRTSDGSTLYNYGLAKVQSNRQAYLNFWNETRNSITISRPQSEGSPNHGIQ